jgi:hypothetical protein
MLACFVSVKYFKTFRDSDRLLLFSATKCYNLGQQYDVIEVLMAIALVSWYSMWCT